MIEEQLSFRLRPILSWNFPSRNTEKNTYCIVFLLLISSRNIRHHTIYNSLHLMSMLSRRVTFLSTIVSTSSIPSDQLPRGQMPARLKQFLAIVVNNSKRWETYWLRASSGYCSRSWSVWLCLSYRIHSGLQDRRGGPVSSPPSSRSISPVNARHGHVNTQFQKITISSPLHEMGHNSTIFRYSHVLGGLGRFCPQLAR